ncbi:MAG: hypothetical protein VX768_06085 [Planctomycetota bacterium]|nr:hypothetical protein [Planctomycetota bacterium]
MKIPFQVVLAGMHPHSGGDGHFFDTRQNPFQGRVAGGEIPPGRRLSAFLSKVVMSPSDRLVDGNS